MPEPPLILLMGSQGDGLYGVAESLKKAGLNCGLPLPFLANHLRSRHMPPHSGLWFWSAIRRIFEDLRLPAIAEPPPERISTEFTNYCATLLGRCLAASLRDGPAIIADHLTALALPFLLEALERLNVPCRMFFLFSDPRRGIAGLLRARGQAQALTEFAWRNTVAAAVRHAGRKIRFLEFDALDEQGWRKLAGEFETFLDVKAPMEAAFPPVSSLPGNIDLAPQTRELYEALCGHARGACAFQALEYAAAKAFGEQRAQNGWQFVECLDCGEMKAHMHDILAGAGKPLADKGLLELEDSAGWADLLGAAERKLVDARNDFESRLFAISSGLHKFYMNQLEDMRLLEKERDIIRQKKALRRRLRHRDRLRALWRKEKDNDNPQD